MTRFGSEEPPDDGSTAACHEPECRVDGAGQKHGGGVPARSPLVADPATAPTTLSVWTARRGRHAAGGHRLTRTVAVAALGLCLVVGWSIGRALGRPSTETAGAKLAEWARDHELGPVVTGLEQWQNDLHPAKVGGAPPDIAIGGLPVVPATAAPRSAKTRDTVQTSPPAPLKPFGSAIPGEGVWVPLAYDGAQPAIYGTGLRPDTVHTSYVVHVAWMDPRLTRFQLRPGKVDPGGLWPVDSEILPQEREGLLATFNGGFRLTDLSHPATTARAAPSRPWSPGRRVSSCAPTAPPMSAPGTRRSG